MRLDLLKLLSETPAIPGYEDRVRELVASELCPLVDECSVDTMGDLVAFTGAVLIGRLVTAVEDTGLGQVFVSPDIDVGGSTLRPDAVVVLNANAGIVASKRLVVPPDLAVEIASPSTAAYDRDADEGKRGAYARMGVPEYWIVDVTTRTIEVLVLAGDAYSELGSFAGDTPLQSRVLPHLTLPARRFFPREA